MANVILDNDENITFKDIGGIETENYTGFWSKYDKCFILMPKDTNIVGFEFYECEGKNLTELNECVYTEVNEHIEKVFHHNSYYKIQIMDNKIEIGTSLLKDILNAYISEYGMAVWHAVCEEKGIK